MTNFEAYKDDLMKIDDGDIAFDKIQRKVVRCCCESAPECEDCEFDQKCYESKKIKWLYEKYEPPVLSGDEFKLINILEKINKKQYRYVTRDVEGVIRLYEEKPHINKSGNLCGEYTYVDSASGDKILFPNIAHENGIYDITEECFIEE